MAYVNDRRCIRIEGDQLGLSSLYRWYRDDFGPTDRDVINHLMAYAAPNLAMKLAIDQRRRFRLAAERRLFPSALPLRSCRECRGHAAITSARRRRRKRPFPLAAAAFLSITAPWRDRCSGRHCTARFRRACSC